MKDAAGRATRLAPRTRRGRPSKFGRPSRVVAMTLPDDVIRALGDVDRDAGWAIVKLLEGSQAAAATMPPAAHPDVELVAVGGRRSLIVINRVTIPTLPGVNLLPLSDTRAFLAFDPGRGLSDLELAIIDRLADPAVNGRERDGLERMRSQLAAWRHDRSLAFHTRAIVVVERIRRAAPPVGGRAK